MSHKKKFFYFFCLSLFVISIIFFSNINFFYETRIKFGKAIQIGINFLFKKKNYENLKTKINSGLLTSKFEDLKFKTINLNKRDSFMRRPFGYLEIIDDNIIYLLRFLKNGAYFGAFLFSLYNQNLYSPIALCFGCVALISYHFFISYFSNSGLIY